MNMSVTQTHDEGSAIDSEALQELLTIESLKLYADYCRDLDDYQTEHIALALIGRTRQVDDLAMMVRRLAHALKKRFPNSMVASESLDYLKRNDMK